MYDAVPVASITGSGEVYMKAGSDINITCVVIGYVKPINILWFHEKLEACELFDGNYYAISMNTDLDY